jgi:hypothetical protein
MELLIKFISSLPLWLGTVLQVLIVAMLFTTSVVLLIGIWIGIKLVVRQGNRIKAISFVPPKIEFNE